VIHHGGIGTTAQALRCGRPMLVEPYCNDQFYNAARVAALGIGAALYPRDATADRLADVLTRAVLTEQTRSRAAELAAGIAAEDGLTTACQLIEGQLGT
jgi:UDP:flavonoid glycosyltransferase YjiC (YdhE family)